VLAFYCLTSYLRAILFVCLDPLCCLAGDCQIEILCYWPFKAPLFCFHDYWAIGVSKKLFLLLCEVNYFSIMFTKAENCNEGVESKDLLFFGTFFFLKTYELINTKSKPFYKAD